MKLPSSSSILLATLAISCSSSSLAAPTGPGDTSLASSSSNHHLSFHRGGHTSRGPYSPGTTLKRRSDRIVERRLDYAEHMKARDSVPGVVENVLDVVGRLLGKLLAAKSSVSGLNVDSVQYISPEDMDKLKSAIDEFSALIPDTGARSSSVAPTASSSTSSVSSSSATPLPAAAPVDVSAAPSNSTSAPSSAPTGANTPALAVPLAVDASNGSTRPVDPATSPSNAATPPANAPANAAAPPALPATPPALPVTPPALPATPPPLPATPPPLPVAPPTPRR